MTDQPRSRARRRDDTVVPLLMGALAVTIAGPAMLAAAMHWAQPRWLAVRLTVTEWWARNWWLVAFWAVEFLVLAIYLLWFRRRSRRRRVQLDVVSASLARVLPGDWVPERHLRVTRWHGHRPVRVRVQLTPRSPLADYTWRRSVETALGHALGPTEPLPWPSQATGALAWDLRRPRLDVRVLTRPPLPAVPRHDRWPAPTRQDERRPDTWPAPPPQDERRHDPWPVPAQPRSSGPPRSSVSPPGDRDLTTADQRPYD